MKEFEAHILVVDDDKGIRELVKQYLDEYGFITSTAQNAEDAIDKVNQIKFDLIILDIMMPGKSGLEFLKENKNDIDTLFGIGGDNKSNSSSWILKKWKEK